LTAIVMMVITTTSIATILLIMLHTIMTTKDMELGGLLIIFLDTEVRMVTIMMVMAMMTKQLTK
jgi:hypothetical protein